ncbi:O-antigen ligase family protein [Halobacillus litoralis]|uniref:O-antigen ligase family protein n=1 Tax=Halobacillus litoralis TaxID=45668 RepID=UPI001CD34750|nr:O-antigen ligase family protein [Halobacillus litoralis]MCA0970933.1 O-antigen ligase family protein [Halobacillus litoralis]
MSLISYNLKTSLLLFMLSIIVGLSVALGYYPISLVIISSIIFLISLKKNNFKIWFYLNVFSIMLINTKLFNDYYLLFLKGYIYIFILLCLYLYLTNRRLENFKSVPLLKGPEWLVLLYLLGIFASVTKGHDFINSLWIFISILVTVFSFYLFNKSIYLNNTEKILHFLKIIFYSLVVLSIIGHLISYFGFVWNFGATKLTQETQLYRNVISFGVFDNPNTYGSIIMFGVPIGFILYLCSSHKFEKIRYLLFTLYLIVSILTTFSRSAMLFITLSLLISVILQKNTKSLKPLLLILFMFIATLPFINSNNLFLNAYERFRNKIEYGGLSYRNTIWEKSLSSIIDNPLFGVGPGDFQVTNFIGEKISAHNAYLQIAASNGLVTLMFFLIFIVSVLVSYYNSFVKIKKQLSYTSKIILTVCFSMCFSFLVHQLFESHLSGGVSTVNFLFWSILAILPATINAQTKMEE